MWGKVGSWWDDNIVHGGINTASIGNQIKDAIPESGDLSFMGMEYGWGKKLPPEEDLLKYGFLALGVFVIIKIAGK
jgi:hypothetical protein